MKQQLQNKNGFTLLEVLLSVALITALAGLSLPVSQQWVQRTDLNIATESVVHSMRRAQVLAQAQQGDQPWGVAIDVDNNNLIIIFAGSDFASRNQALDETYEMSPGIEVNGDQEIVFVLFSGRPENTATVELSLLSGDSRTINVNSYGISHF